MEASKPDNPPQGRGCPGREGVEPRDGAEAVCCPSASPGGGNNEAGEAERLLEAIVSAENLNRAYKRVKANGGAPGADGMTTEELLPYLKAHGAALRRSLLEGRYRPQAVRRVEIPKPGGGVRELGIPTVVDRVIQQAIAQVLEGVFDKGFSANSYGFRPGRSAHMAIKAARKHIEEGRGHVVDLDLEKFFDRVNHDKLMSLAARKVKDKRVLRLVRRYLEAGVMLSGVKVRSEEGTPQGGPLSPLLANIMLDELDRELARRGHRFCRYADDCNIYVGSKRAGLRVMAGVTRYIERVLKLKVNREKSAVDKPGARKFLGFSFYMKEGKARNFVHARSVRRFREKVREILSRSNGQSMERRRERLAQLITGWVNYFGIADMRSLARGLDGWIRRRIRMCYWKQWKRGRTRHDNLVRLGIKTSKAWEYANSRKGSWRISGSVILEHALNDGYLKGLGFPTLAERLSPAC